MELCHQSLLNLPGSLPSCCCSMQQPPLLTALPEGTIMSHLTELITATLHPPPPSLAQTTSAGTPSCLPRLPLPSPPPTDLLLCGLHGERSCYAQYTMHACSTTVQCLSLQRLYCNTYSLNSMRAVRIDHEVWLQCGTESAAALADYNVIHNNYFNHN